MEVSNLTRKRISEYLAAGKRFDARGLLDYRDIKIETGISKNAEGTARVRIGKTEVLAGIKMSVAEPYADSEDSGVLTTTVELLPLSSSKFELGPPGIEAIELARIVDRGIRESGFIDFKKLCIVKGEKVFNIYLDIYPINHDGNLIDAAVIAAVSALLSAKMPKMDKENNIEHGEFSNKGLPLTKNVPITITFHKIDGHVLVDPVVEEEETSEGRISIAVSHDKKPMINAVQKGGGNVAFSVEEVFKIIDEAVKKSKEILNVINKQIKVENGED